MAQAGQSVAIIGAGSMGLGMAKCLISKGYTVFVRDVDPAREQLARAAGAQVVACAQAAAQAANVVLVVVLDAKQIDEVFAGEQGLLSGLTGQSIVLLCSTIAPEDTMRLAEQIQATGALAVDAPISGGPARATTGMVSMMLAAAATTLEKIHALTLDLSAKQFLVSHQLGDATRAKLVNNMMAAANLVAASQAMQLAKSMGLDWQTMANITAASSGQSWIADDRFARALVNDYEPRAQLHVLTKDIRLAVQAAHGLQLTVPIAEQAALSMQAACDAGYRLEDDAAMFKYFA